MRKIVIIVMEEDIWDVIIVGEVETKIVEVVMGMGMLQIIMKFLK